MTNGPEGYTPKIKLPPRKPPDEPRIHLPRRRLVRNYQGSEFVQPGRPDFRYATDFTNDSDAQKFVLRIYNQVNSDYVRQLVQWTAEGREGPKPSFPTMARTAVQAAFPLYSPPVDPSVPYPPESLAEEVARLRDDLVEAGGATIGGLLQDQAAVCLEQSIVLHAVLNEKRTPNRVALYFFTGVTDGHAAVEYSEDGIEMVGDPSWGFTLPKKEAHDRYREEVQQRFPGASGEFQVWRQWQNRGD